MFGLFKSKKKLTRKAKTERFLKLRKVKINYNLPRIESEEETVLRTPTEIAIRLSVLAISNLVAFNSMSAEQAINYLKEYKLWTHVTPDEKDFLENPTAERKIKETWKCEGIWVLMWALKVVNEIEFPNTLCDLNKIPSNQYPIVPGKDPNEFINNMLESRTKSEILDANDLYYRINWACVDARINGAEIKGINSGVVYERHYTLNWLIKYMDQEWDDISTDT